MGSQFHTGKVANRHWHVHFHLRDIFQGWRWEVGKASISISVCSLDCLTNMLLGWFWESGKLIESAICEDVLRQSIDAAEKTIMMAIMEKYDGILQSCHRLWLGVCLGRSNPERHIVNGEVVGVIRGSHGCWMRPKKRNTCAPGSA
jgi:hypothetical protein